MKRLNIIRVTLKMIFTSLPIMFFGASLMPLLLIFVGTLSHQNFEVHHTASIAVEIIDEDQTMQSQQFLQLFEEEPFIHDENEALFRIIVLKGYEESVIEGNIPVITIEPLRGPREIMRDRIIEAIEGYHKQLQIQHLIEFYNLTTDEDLTFQLQQISEQTSVVTTVLNPQDRLPLFERNVILVSGFLVLGVVQTLVKGGIEIDKTDLSARLYLAPLTRAQLYHHAMIETWFYALVSFGLFFVPVAIFSSYIRQHHFSIILVVALLALFALTLTQLLKSFVPESVRTPLIVSATFFEMIFGFWQIAGDDFILHPPFWPGRMVQNLLTMILTENLQSIAPYVGVILISAFFTYIGVRLQLRLKWGRQ